MDKFIFVGLILVASLVSAVISLIALAFSALLHKNVKKRAIGLGISLLCFVIAFALELKICDDAPNIEEVRIETTTVTASVTTEVTEETEPETTTPTTVAVTEPEVATEENERLPEDEVTDAERLGVSEVELRKIEHCMSVAGWNYDRSDFERIYRLKDNEMILNPATFVEYEVTIKDEGTHNLTLNRSLIDE